MKKRAAADSSKEILRRAAKRAHEVAERRLEALQGARFEQVIRLQSLARTLGLKFRAMRDGGEEACVGSAYESVIELFVGAAPLGDANDGWRATVEYVPKNESWELTVELGWDGSVLKVVYEADDDDDDDDDSSGDDSDDSSGDNNESSEDERAMGSYLLKILQDNNETQLLAELAWMIKFDQAVEKKPGAVLRASVEKARKSLEERCPKDMQLHANGYLVHATAWQSNLSEFGHLGMGTPLMCAEKGVPAALTPLKMTASLRYQIRLDFESDFKCIFQLLPAISDGWAGMNPVISGIRAAFFRTGRTSNDRSLHRAYTRAMMSGVHMGILRDECLWYHRIIFRSTNTNKDVKSTGENPLQCSNLQNLTACLGPCSYRAQLSPVRASCKGLAISPSKKCRA